MKNIKEYEYKNKVLEDGEISANRLNLVFLVVSEIISIIVILLMLFKVFPIRLQYIVPMLIIVMIIFAIPVLVYLIHDKLIKKDRSILSWKKFKYIIFICAFTGFLLVDVILSFHAILLLAIPPLMASQYNYNKRDWIIIFIITIITIPIITYGGFIFGIADRNLFKNMITDEEAEVIANRIEILSSKRIVEILLHYVIPRILAICVIDFLIAAILKRNQRMLEKEMQLSLEVQEEIQKNNLIQQRVIEELASVIESRDVSTGEHVRRTKKYVEILCHQLAKMDKYKDVLTEDAINNIVSAAPLHDIGKIVVSDLILLKPGKLTKEEFDAMKIHTSKGGEMIKNFFNNFENEGFIERAYEIAMYHHEKWDGSGYPCNLKDNEIPLSARIMAISDVFDALVSKRVYKDSMDVEDAFKIIVEDAGKHFDPELIEATKLVKEEFFEVAKSNNLE